MDRERSYLYIDLSTQRYGSKAIVPEIARDYPGGIALATFLLHELLPPGADPLCADNVVVFAAGLLAGTPYPGGTRMGVATKSPLTGLWAGGTVGGNVPWALRQTPWDAV